MAGLNPVRRKEDTRPDDKIPSIAEVMCDQSQRAAIDQRTQSAGAPRFTLLSIRTYSGSVSRETS